MKVAPVPIEWHPGLPIYASEAFLRSVSGEYGWLGGIEDGRLACVLAYSIIRKSVFRLVRFPVQTILLKADMDVEQERRFLECALPYFRQIGADLIIPATFCSVFRTYPKGAAAAPYGSCIVDLTQNEDALWKNLHSKHRNVIRNARNRGVSITSGLEHLETAYSMTLESFRRSADGVIARRRVEQRLDFETFRRQILAFGDRVRVLVAQRDGVPQSVAVIPFSEHSAYYMHGGCAADAVNGASNLLQWEAIRLFHDLGVRKYDFFGARINPAVGSKAEGLLRFKERFGGELTRGFMWKYAFRPLKHVLYRLAARLRSGGDVVDQERHKLMQAV